VTKGTKRTGVTKVTRRTGVNKETKSIRVWLRELE